MTTINEELHLNNSSKQLIDKKILDRSRSVMINNLGSFLNSDPSTSTNPSTWEEDEVDEDSRILKINPIRGLESRKITEIPMYNLKTLGSVLHKRKFTKEEVSQRVSQFRKTMLEDESWRESVHTVTWDESLEFEDCDNKCESSTPVVEVGIEDLEWELCNEFDQDCMENRFNEKRNGCTPPTEMYGDSPSDHDDWLVEPSSDGVSLPV